MRLGSKELHGLALGSALALAALGTAYAVGRQPHEWLDVPGALRVLDGSSDATASSAASANWDLPVKRTDRVAYWEGMLTGRGGRRCSNGWSSRVATCR